MAPRGIIPIYLVYFLVGNAALVVSQQSCRIFNLDPPVRFSFADCVTSENGWNHGCRLILSCEPGSMPVAPIPLLEYAGTQTLLCVNGTWMTTLNAVGNPVNCVTGCIPRNYTTQIVNDRRIFTYYDIELLKTYTAVCQTSVLTTREELETMNPGIIPYYCPMSDADVEASGCENMCAMTYRVPNNNKILKPFVEVNDDMFMFTFGDMEMIVGCQDGYEYERSSLYYSYGQQVILCNGTSGKLIDNVTRTEVEIVPCVQKPTCSDLSMSSNVGMVVENSQCVPNNGQLPDGCVRAYYCNEGYHPNDLNYLYNGTQRVRCDNSRWIDQQNRTITSSLTCVNGCINLNYTSIISYITSHEYSIDYNEYEVNGLRFQCLTSQSQTTISQFIQRIREHSNPYFCRDTASQNNTYVVIESICENSCRALNTTALPEGLETFNTPSSIIVSGSAQVVANTSYYFRCRDGYRYIDATARNIGMQQFTCLQNGAYLDSIRSTIFGSANVPLLLCEKMSSCSQDHWGSDQSIIIYNSTCSTNEPVVNCEDEITCANGYYPSLEKYQFVKSVRKVCRVTTDGIAEWVDVITGSTVNDYQCISGCIPRATENRTYSYNGFQIFCILPVIGNDSPFYCGNMSNQTNGPTCTHTCMPLQGANSLLRTNLYESLIIDRFVAQGDGFRFSCPAGTVFRDTQTISKEFRCSGNVAYIDLSTNTTTSFVIDTCVVPNTGSSCSAAVPQNDIYTTRNYSCTRDSNNRIEFGCRVELSCLDGSSFSSNTLETRRSYICENTGLFRNLDSNTVVELLIDVCRNYNSTVTTQSSTTVTAATTTILSTTATSTTTITPLTSSTTTTAIPSSTVLTSTTTSEREYILLLRYMLHVLCLNHRLTRKIY